MWHLTIQTQWGQGIWIIEFSSELNLGDAISAAGKLKSMLRLSELHQGVSENIKDTLKEEQLLHPATSGLMSYVLVLVFLWKWCPHSLLIDIGRYGMCANDTTHHPSHNL